MKLKNIYDILNYICIHEKFVIQNQSEFHAYKYYNIFHLGIIFFNSLDSLCVTITKITNINLSINFNYEIV